MRTISPSRTAWVTLAGTVLLLAGCVVAPPGPYGGPDVAGEWVASAPPAPRYEVIGVAPLLGQIWIGGHWGWGGGRHHWVPGRWADARPGHVWVPHAWAPGRGGWRLKPGHWRRR